jgi:hypothetical protein
MSAREFRDDDAGYLAWLSAHPDGYVINIGRSHGRNAARVHQAGCRTISGQSALGDVWTAGQYVKVCAEHLAELEMWEINKVEEPIRRCGICHPGRDRAPSMSPARTDPAAGPALQGRWEVHEPVPGGAVVEAWADDYIRFERRPAWQERLRTQIRSRCTQLQPADEQLLQATFFGTKLPNADVENLVLYNIGSFAIAGRNGIRVEYDTAVPPAPDGGRYRFCYRYALVPRSGTFNHWRQGRTLASFDWTDLGDFAGDKKLAQVWLALARSRDEGLEPACPPGTPFAVKVKIRPPHRLQRVWGGLLKGIFDGVVCAFQAHTDTQVLPVVVERLAKVLPRAEPAEIEQLLLDQRRAALGVVPRLVAPYRKGVKWNPADHLCLAGELLVADALDERWAIKGRIVELSGR